MLIVILSLFFQTAEVKQVPEKAAPSTKEVGIFIDSEEYIDRLNDFHDIDIVSNPPIEHLLYLDSMIKKYDLPERIMYRLVFRESEYCANAISPKGAWGYMQTMPATFCEEASRLGLDSSVYSNIEVGCYYMRKMLNEFDDERLALAAYNSGPNRVKKLNRIPRIEQTQKYVKYIMQ